MDNLRWRTVIAVAAILAGFTVAPASGQSRLSDQAKLTEREIAQVRAELDASVAAYEQARTDMAQAARTLREARERQEAVASGFAVASDRLNRRAIAVYKGERLQLLDALLGSKSIDVFWRRAVYAAKVANSDASAVSGLERSVSDAKALRSDVRDSAAAVHARLMSLNGAQEDVTVRLSMLNSQLAAVNAAIEEARKSWRFPVTGITSFVDSFGAPRMVGTADEHSHEGQDIFAPSGSSVVAVVNGTVSKVGEDRLGGMKVWLDGDDGFRYYYAHLSGWAPAAVSGAHVEAGTVLGYVGATGNAVGTPPHLHFEMHDSGGAINPYQRLKDADVR